jgi:flavin reductase (DIM6/NTAB) family NADH-FMN oxidoreductase RutF
MAILVAWLWMAMASRLIPLEMPPILSVPVFSLATIAADGSTNMNLLTYAAPVGIRPVRRWAISLYRQTESRANFMARRAGVLQLLSDAHENHALIHTLGGASARDVDKRALCADAGFAWLSEGEVASELLPGCVAYYRLELEGEPFDAGDHEVAICKVVATYAPASGESCAQPLETARLRALGMITDAGRAVPLPS